MSETLYIVSFVVGGLIASLVQAMLYNTTVLKGTFKNYKSTYLHLAVDVLAAGVVSVVLNATGFLEKTAEDDKSLYLVSAIIALIRVVAMTMIYGIWVLKMASEVYKSQTGLSKEITNLQHALVHFGDKTHRLESAI